MPRFGGYQDSLKHSARFWRSIDGEKLMRERYGISDIVNDGDERRCRCPLPFGLHKHGDRSGKFSMNVRKNVCGCWVCGSGNMLWFIKSMEGVDDTGAVAIAKQYARNMTDEEFEASLKDEFDASTGMSEPIRQSVFYEDQTKRWAESDFIQYWLDRGFNRDTIDMWRLGYDWDENRVTVPHVFDSRVVGYQKRTLSDTPYSNVRDCQPEKKWTNNYGFPRKETLFGYDTARIYNSVILVEAALSAIWLWQCGVPNVVASFGSKVTKQQMSLLRRFADVIVWFDADEAGKVGTRTVVDGLYGLADVWVVQCEQGDPNEISQGVLRPTEDVWHHLYGKGLVPSYLWQEV